MAIATVSGIEDAVFESRQGVKFRVLIYISMLLLATKFALLLFVFGETKRQMGLEKE
jgi:hypothetical protein